MEKLSRGRPEEKPSDPGEGGAAVRTPSKGDRPSSGTILPQALPPVDQTAGDASDTPTFVDVTAHSSDASTMVDDTLDLGPDSPTMIEGSPVPGKAITTVAPIAQRPE